MHRHTPRSIVALTALTATLLASQAHAGCGAFGPATVSPQSPAPTMQQDRWLPEPADGAAAHMLQAAYLLPVSDREYSNLPIVGLWKFTMIAKGNTAGPPDGTPIDAGYQTWHADRTEIMNSGRPADTSNFCMGVWKPTGRNSFRLNHVALSWTGVSDGKTNTFVGVASIHEDVTLSGDNRFDGMFSIDQYDDKGITVKQHVVGTVAATRVTVD